MWQADVAFLKICDKIGLSIDLEVIPLKIAVPAFPAALLQALNGCGFEAYLVGGCVRDSLCGRQPVDWDITTSASPDQVKNALRRYHVVDTGVTHGTVTAVCDNQAVEITTFRVESSYSDHRHPDAVRFTLDLKEDLARRDFTINAMAYHPNTGVIDFFGGQQDLGRRQLRCVGTPSLRFEEDALRILRALRFASALGFRIEPQTAAAVHQQCALLRTVAAERVYSELTKLLCGDGVRAVLTDFADVIGVCIPELLDCVGFAQQTPYHNFDVYEHTVRALAALPSCAYLRWAMLLHDIGKPRAFTLDAQHQAHFYGHEKISAEMAERILRRLRAGNKLIERVTLLIRHHDADLEPTEPCLSRWLNRLGDEALLQLILLQKADDSAKSAMVRFRMSNADRLYALAEELVARGTCYSLKTLAVNGNDLLALGYTPGAPLGDALERLLQEVMAQRCPNEREALLRLAASWRE